MSSETSEAPGGGDLPSCGCCGLPCINCASNVPRRLLVVIDGMTEDLSCAGLLNGAFVVERTVGVNEPPDSCCWYLERPHCTCVEFVRVCIIPQTSPAGARVQCTFSDAPFPNFGGFGTERIDAPVNCWELLKGLSLTPSDITGGSIACGNPQVGASCTIYNLG